jgi:hypothetical protein
VSNYESRAAIDTCDYDRGRDRCLCRSQEWAQEARRQWQEQNVLRHKRQQDESKVVSSPIRLRRLYRCRRRQLEACAASL